MREKEKVRGEQRERERERGEEERGGTERDCLRGLISFRHNPDGFGPHVRGLMHVYCVQLELARALVAFIPFSALFSLPGYQRYPLSPLTFRRTHITIPHRPKTFNLTFPLYPGI